MLEWKRTKSAMLVLMGMLPTSISAQQPAAGSLVFDGVTVVDAERGKLAPNQRVMLSGNRIQVVGDARTVTLSQRAQVVGARGKFLIPGLWDLHVHSVFARRCELGCLSRRDARMGRIASGRL